MQLFGHRPKRRAGQNFLVHASTAERFVDTATHPALANVTTVVEIGPGLGAITQILCRRFPQVIAIEADRRLVKIWQEKLSQPKNLQLIQADATNFDYARLAKRLGHRLCIFGNLPFNVSTVILERLFSQWQHISYAHLTFQQEVAARLVAKPGSRDYGSLTLFAYLYCDVEKQLNIDKNQFFPLPKVDTTVVGLSFLDHPRVEAAHLKDFEKFVRQLFMYRRKTLLNGLKQIRRFSSSLAQAQEYLQQQKLKADIRVERLTPAEIYELYCYCCRKEA